MSDERPVGKPAMENNDEYPATWGRGVAATVVTITLSLIANSWYQEKRVQWANEETRLVKEKKEYDMRLQFDWFYNASRNKPWLASNNSLQQIPQNRSNFLCLNYLAHLLEKNLIADKDIDKLGKCILLDQNKLINLNRVLKEVANPCPAEALSLEDYEGQIKNGQHIIDELNATTKSVEKIFDDYFRQEQVVSERWTNWRETLRKEGKWNDLVTCNFKDGLSEFGSVFPFFNYYLLLIDNDILDKKYRDLSEAEIQRIGKEFTELMVIHEVKHQECAKWRNGTHTTDQHAKCSEKFQSKLKTMSDLLTTVDQYRRSYDHGTPSGRWFDKLNVWEYLSWSKKWEEWANELKRELDPANTEKLDVIQQEISKMKADNQCDFGVDFR